MLQVLGNLVTKKPWFLVIFILLITIGFSIFLPSLEMNTSMEDFLPDDEVVNANERINEYFGASSESIMVLVDKENTASVVTPDALREMYALSKEVKKIDNVEDTMSIAGFVDIVCGLEYNKSLENCSNDEIQSAYLDLMKNSSTQPIIIESTDDPNEPVEYQRNRFSKKTSIDTLDIKNLKITQNETNVTFTIMLYDVQDIDSILMSRGLKLNVVEWYVHFNNIIGPKELQEMQYSIAAHLQPSSQLWEIGKGPLQNLNHIFQLIRNRELKNEYTMDAVLWMQPPGEDMAFQIPLETGNVSWDSNQDSISISVSRKELGDYGIAFEDTGFGMPARLGNISSGVRAYQFPLFNMPWKRVTINMRFIQNRIERWQNRLIIGKILDRVLTNNMGMNLSDLNDLMSMDDQSMMADSLSLPQFGMYWIQIDRAPDTGVMSETIFIKPGFLTNLKDSVINFLSSDYTIENGAKSCLMMVNVNGSLSLSQLDEVSKQVVETVNSVDGEEESVSFHATGNSIIEYEINEVTMDANSIIIPLIFVVICIILFISFRKLSYVVLPLVGLTFALIWTFGTMVIFNFPFIVLEVALIPMLMGLGVDYSVHLYHNYRVERGKGKSPDKAMNQSIEDIGMAMLLATITTFIAFLSFLTATMVPLRDFGLLCAIGIAYIFAITLTFQASMRFILDRRKMNKHDIKKVEKKKEYGKGMRHIARVVCTHPAPILLVTVLLTVGLTYGAIQIETGFSMEDFLPEENPSVVVLNQILDEFPFASQEREYVLIEGTNIATTSMLEGVDQTIDHLDDDSFVLFTRDNEPKTNSVLSVISKAVADNSSLVNKFSLNDRGIPTTNQNVVAFFDYLYDNDAYGREMQTYLHRTMQGTYDASVIHIYTNINGDNGDDSSDVMGDLYNGLQQDIKGVYPDSVTATITGDNSQMYVIMNSMTESQLISTVFCLVLAAIVLIIAYRNPVLGLITMIPVAVSTIWIVGAMYYIGYSLNVMTIMITSLTIGLGITYAIHAVERFRLVAEYTGDVIEAVSETIGHTGGALLISAVTTILGFGMLALVPMPVEQQFGLITALTILFAFLTSIFILPPVLLFWGKYRKKHRGYVISPGDPNERKNNNKLFGNHRS